MTDMRFPVIDFHTHTFPPAIAERALRQLSAASHTRPFTDGTGASLSLSMRAAGVARSVVLPVATNPRQVVKVNDASVQMNERTGETGLASFGCMHPDFEDWHAELSRIRDAGIRGIKLHPIYQGVDFDDIRTLRILSRAAELDLVVVIHAGLDVGFPGVVHASPRMILHALQEVGPLRLILAHMGGWRCWDEVEDLLPGTGVYIDTSFSLGKMTPNGDGHYRDERELDLLDDAQFVHLVRVFGADRVLFGTDSPWADQSAALGAFLRLPLSDSEKRRILCDNALTLYPGLLPSDIPERVEEDKNTNNV